MSDLRNKSISHGGMGNMPIRIECDGYQFEWVEDWVRVPTTLSASQNGRTHGVAVTRDGTVVIFHQANPAVVLYGSDGTMRAVWGDSFPGAHGLTLVEERDEERLWLTDESTGTVVKTTLTGRVLAEIERPPHAEYERERYSPTWVAVNERRFGGNGDVWVADGYGAGLVHRYDRDGHYLSTLTGEEGAGRFDCPHGLYMRHVDGRHELFVADRGNARFQVYDAEGVFQRIVGEGLLQLPCACLELDDGLIVPELNARLAVLDGEGLLKGYLGANDEVCERDDWPNVSADARRPGAFISPHAAAADRDGNLYIVEWIVGGRITKLAAC